MNRNQRLLGLALAAGWVLGLVATPLAMAESRGGSILSHPPQRPLPSTARAEAVDPQGRSVDPQRGDDAGPGSIERPWRTLKHALRQLEPGMTLYLRGGVYYETVSLTRSGTLDAPITLAGYPGEMAVIDGGLREFLDSPATSWEPLAGGAPGEYVSTRAYPDLDDRPAPHQFLPYSHEPMWGKEEERPLALGHFADSMVPLHGYRIVEDLRATNELWLGNKNEMRDTGIYGGPGLWFNRATSRIHIRLAHHQLAGLGERAYRGETDPRKLPLVVAVGFGRDVFRASGIRHVRVRDLVLRGATGSPMLLVYGSEGIEFDHLTVYGGSPGLLINASKDIRVAHCAFRGLAAPWTSRAHMKYRGTASYQIILQNNQPLNESIEFASCEFTDDHDFAFIRFAKKLLFHHNFVDNFNDDGLECGPKLRSHSLFIYQNRIGACLIPFTQHEFDKDDSPLDHDPRAGVFVYRNVIDLRAGTYKGPPSEPDPSGSFLNEEGHLISDHGGPIWPVFHVYHNTLIRRTPVFRDSYLFGLGSNGLRHTERDVFNNIFIQLERFPGLGFVGMQQAAPVREGGNLLWSDQGEPTDAAAYFAKFRASKLFTDSRVHYEPGWTTQDLVANPRFIHFPDDLRLGADSPARAAGVPVPAEWPDPLRREPVERPDLGALPLGVERWGVGVDGRIPLCGPSDVQP